MMAQKNVGPGTSPDHGPDVFSTLLPLPYRIAILLVLGIWGWGVNLYCLQLAKIDVPSLVRYNSRPTSARLSPHESTYRLATCLSILVAASIVTFWTFTYGNLHRAMAWQTLPNITLLLVIGSFFLPRSFAAGSGRQRLRVTLRRIITGGLASNQDGSFGDILLADALTSYAKVIADLAVVVCLILSSDNTCATKPNRMCGSAYVVPVVTAIPSMIRFKQCLTEYRRARATTSSRGRQHLANALKYSTAFPVVVINAMMRGRSVGDGHPGLSLEKLVQLWWIAIVVNTMYSFYWDIAKDWDLSLFSAVSNQFQTEQQTPKQARPPGQSLHGHEQTPFGLRPRRFFDPSTLYYVAISIDFALRCAPWALRAYSPSLHQFVHSDSEAGMFLMQALEVSRRWMWMFLRIETEWVRMIQSPSLGGVAIPPVRSND